MRLVFLLIFSAVQAVCIFGECTVGRQWASSGPNPTPGSYIDLSHSAMCSGMITQFRVCFHNPRLYNPPEAIMLPVGLQVWRFDEMFNSGDLIHEHTASIDVRNPQMFECRTIALNQSIAAMKGDVLGVRIYDEALLPATENVDTVFAPKILHIPPANYSTSILRHSFPPSSVLTGNAIHLTAEIAVDVTTTDTTLEVPASTEHTTTSASTSSAPSTCPTPQIMNSGGTSNPRVLVGVAIVAVLQAVLIGAAILAIAIGVKLLKNRQRDKRRRRTLSTHKDSLKEDDEMISNEMYGLTENQTNWQSEGRHNELHYSNTHPPSDASAGQMEDQSISMHVNVVYPPSPPQPLPQMNLEHSYEYITHNSSSK